jgi:hypothetical protein
MNLARDGAALTITAAAGGEVAARWRSNQQCLGVLFDIKLYPSKTNREGLEC